MRDGYAVGWFGIPGGPASRSTKTHIVPRRAGGRPLCGCRMGPRMKFQWCGWWPAWDILECVACKRKATDLNKGER